MRHQSAMVIESFSVGKDRGTVELATVKSALLRQICVSASMMVGALVVGNSF